MTTDAPTSWPAPPRLTRCDSDPALCPVCVGLAWVDDTEPRADGGPVTRALWYTPPAAWRCLVCDYDSFEAPRHGVRGDYGRGGYHSLCPCACHRAHVNPLYPFAARFRAAYSDSDSD